MPLRDKHHNICDLRCLTAGNIVFECSQSHYDAPVWAPLFLLRYRSVAHYSGALSNEVVLPQPLQVGGIGFYVYYPFHISLFHSIARMRLILIVAESRSFAEEESRKGELSRDGIAVHCLLRDVQEHTVVVLVCVKVQ